MKRILSRVGDGDGGRWRLAGRAPFLLRLSYGPIVEIEGVIDEFEWRAPHSLLKVKTDDGSMHIFEWQAPGSLQRRGVQQDTLKTGDRIVVGGNPHREFEQNRILNFKSVRRLSDGWKWPNW